MGVSSAPHSRAGFPTTSWGCIARASDPADPAVHEALARLCAAYWFPIYAFIRRRGHERESALDLTQDYFARLLEKRIVAKADPSRGRFRSFLLADCVHFLAQQRDRENARMRGGDVTVFSIDAGTAEGRYLVEPAHDLTPDRLFDRAWALALLDGVLATLRDEYQRSGRAALFEELKIVLTDEPRSLPQSELAARLNTTPGAIQVAVHRLRKRYRELVREAIAATVADPDDVESEIRDLFAALGG
jgi:RNA polymerase sigma-70 factor (ECF subfamily)